MSVLPVNGSVAYYVGHNTSGGSATSGSARCGYYDGTVYSGRMIFNLSAMGDLSNANISKITMTFTIGALGGVYDKHLILTHSGRGTTVGTYTLGSARNTTKTLVFSSSSNSTGFSRLKSYIEGLSGTTAYLGCISHSPSREPSYSGKGYDWDYMNITAVKMTVEYGYNKSTGTISTCSTGSPATMTIKANSNTYSHKATWRLGSWTGTSTSVAGASTIQITIPHSALPNAVTGTATVTLETLDGSTSLGSDTYSFTVNVPSSVKPSITSNKWSITAVQQTSVGGTSIYIQNNTKPKVTLSSGCAVAGSGASITNYSLTTSPNCGSVSVSSWATGDSGAKTLNLLSSSGTVTFSLKVTDSRGRVSDAGTKTITVQAYSYPTVVGTPTLFRSDSSGNRQDTSGKYVSLSFKLKFSSILNGSTQLNYIGNTATAVKKIVLNSVTTNFNKTDTTTIIDQANNTYTDTLILGAGNLAVDSTYNGTITIKDLLGHETTYGITVPSATYVLHIKKGGKALGIGTAAGTNNTLDIAWKTNIKANDNNLVVQGINVGDTAAANRTALYVTDSNFKSFGMLRALTYEDGAIGYQVGARRDVNNSGVFCGLTYKIASDGTKSFLIDSVSALRNALGLGNTSGAVPIANGGTGQTTAAAALGALSVPTSNADWKSAPIGISYYRYEGSGGASTYDLPQDSVMVIVHKYSNARGIALAYRWSRSGSNSVGMAWMNTCHDSWNGWSQISNSYASADQVIGVWTDGAKLYRYCCSGSTTSTGDVTTSSTLPRTPTNIISIRGAFQRDSAEWRPITFHSYAVAQHAVSVCITTDNKIHLYIGSSMTGTKKWNLIVEYTA